MYTVTLDQITVKAGETAQLSLTIKDNDGEFVDVSSGVTGELKIARREFDAAILTVDDDDFDYSGHTVTIEIDSALVVDTDSPENQLTGDFIMQISLTSGGNTLYVAEGVFTIAPVIT